MSTLSLEEIAELGIQAGTNVRISRYAHFYNAEVVIGSNVRIDDFCILKGKICIGDNVHVGAYSLIGGVGGEVRIGSNVGISNGVSIYTSTENFLSKKRGNPTLPASQRDVTAGLVAIGDDCIVGAGVKVLPGVCVGSGSSISANCVLSRGIPEKTFVIQRHHQREIRI